MKILIGAVVLLGGLGAMAAMFPNNGPVGTNEDDVRRAALEIVWPLPDCSKSWEGGTVEQCDAAKARLDARRKEFDNFEPPWMRKAIFHWLDFAEREIREAREDCITQKSRHAQDDYEKRRQVERDGANAVLRSIGREMR